VSRAAVVYNPIKVTDLPALTTRVEKFLSEQGWEQPLWLETTEEDPGVGMCREALDQGCDVVFVCGGDGTVMAAATALAGQPVPLAILPAGTGNLLARNLDLPINDEAQCLRIGVSGRTRAIDVAAVEDRKFVVMAGLGFDAAVMRDAPEGLKKKVGWPAYVVSATKHLRGRGIRVTITIDDGPPLHRRVRTVVVGNVGKLQGNIPLLPDAQPDDGVLDVVVIAIRNVLDWARVAGRVVRRAHVPDRRMERFTGKHVLIECSHTQPRQLDGDVIESSRTMDIQIEPGALQVRVAGRAG
jgi:YegS/Rv2252/BmrU family lipid kinase